jgi:hypothetical protein
MPQASLVRLQPLGHLSIACAGRRTRFLPDKDAMPQASLVRLQPLGHLSIACAGGRMRLALTRVRPLKQSNPCVGSAAGYGGRFDKLQGGSRGFPRASSQRCEKGGEALRNRAPDAS